ncbi:MAG: hypothetical protein MI749_06670, partial [Desulfovibrionales bacterium]|nr:hypothetical protein [Desulfovibrionales bacterium]
MGENGEDAPLSRDELKQLYRISNRLNLKDLDDLVMVLGTLDFVDRRYFLDLAHGSDTDIVSLVRRVEALGPKDVSHFLSVALKLGSGEDLEAFGRSVDVLFGEERSAFLETALFLAQEGGPVDSAHFIRGAAGDLDQAGNLTDRVRSMAGDSQGRSLFLALAAVADKEVGRLLGTLDRFSDSATPFLEAAQGVSGGMGALLDLIQANSGEKNQELMDFLASLAFDDRDNFLLSTRGEGPRMDRLIFLASPMEAHGKSAFFAVASRGDQDHLLVLLEKMDASDRDNLVLAARTAGDRAGELMALMDELKGDQQTQVLAFASGLSHHDLENFLTGARGEDAAAIAAV